MVSNEISKVFFLKVFRRNRFDAFEGENFFHERVESVLSQIITFVQQRIYLYKATTMYANKNSPR